MVQLGSSHPSCSAPAERSVRRAIAFLAAISQAQAEVARLRYAMGCRRSVALVGMACDLAAADLTAARTGIGSELRKLNSEQLREEIHGRMPELLKQLDQLMEFSPRGHQRAVFLAPSCSTDSASARSSNVKVSHAHRNVGLSLNALAGP